MKIQLIFKQENSTKALTKVLSSLCDRRLDDLLSFTTYGYKNPLHFTK